MKKILVFLFLPLLGFVFVCAPFAPSASAAAAAPIVTAGEAMQVAEILDLLSDSGLIDLDAAGTYFTPSLYLRMLSGFCEAAHIPVDEAAPWLDRLFDLNNELFWNEDKTAVLQEHNGILTPVTGVGDLWFTTANMGECGYMPLNYVAQSAGYSIDFNATTSYEAIDIVRNGAMFPFPAYYVLPVLNSGSNLFYCSNILYLDIMGSSVYAASFDSNSLMPLSTQQQILPISDIKANARIAYKNDGTAWYFQTSAYNNYIHPVTGQPSTSSGGNISLFKNAAWRSSSTGNNTAAANGDLSYLYYTSDPISVPPDIPSGNYCYNNDPNNGGKTTIVSPSGDISNLIDYITGGFKFTGTVNQTGDYKISVSGKLDSDVKLTHGGDITINFNDDTNIWSDDGKATDFGNGVSLDGNAFNDGFKWLIDGASAVPVVLQQFTFIPPPVLAIITSGIVVMVFLGLWRTFKG